MSDEKQPDPLAGAFGADWLLRQQFPPTQYIVEGIIPEGVTMLAAAPKIGKSWMVLGLGLAASSGTEAFGGVPTGKPRPVLYLALEDGQSRLKGRVLALGAAAQASSRLQFMTSVPNGGVLAAVDEFAARNDGQHPLVVIDTLGKVMVPAFQGESTYDRDYRVMGKFKEIVERRPGASIIVVHHTRKAPGSDFVDSVSGTQGIAGAADHILLLKRPRNEAQGSLQVTSRDAPEGEYMVEMVGTGNWQLVGGTAAAASKALREHRVTDGVGDRMAEVIAVVNRYPEGIAAKDIKAHLPAISEQVDVYLKRAHEANRIRKLARGKYGPLPESGDC